MAARQLSVLRQSVYNYGYGSSSDATVATAVTDFLNEEYRDIAGERRWEWLQSVNGGTQTVAGTSTYPLPSDARNLDAVFLTDTANVEYFLKWLPPLKILEMLQDDPLHNEGTPRYWTVWAGQIRLYPTPDGVYNLIIPYTKNITALVADTDKPLIPEAYDDVLVWGAVMRMAIRHHDWVTHSFAGTQRDRVLALMRADYELKQRQTSDEVETTGIWSGGLGQHTPWWR